MTTDQASEQPQKTKVAKFPWNPELTKSREDLFKFLLDEGKKKRKRKTSESSDAKRRKVGKWDVTETDLTDAGEKVTEYKKENVATSNTKTSYKEGVSGGSASGWQLGELQARITRSFMGERVNQLLVELSTALFEKVKSTVTKEQEVECLYVGEVLLVSSNIAASANALRTSILNFAGLTYKARKGMWTSEIALTRDAIEKLQQETRPQRKIMESLTYLNEYLAEHPDVYKGIDPAEVVQALLVNHDTSPYVEDIYSWLEYQAIATRLRGLADDKVVSAAPADAASRLAGMTEGVIIVENSFQPLHAELTLLYTYLKSGRSDEIQVYGRKRPCQGCHATLVYVNGLGYPVKFNPHPGNWFEGNIKAAMAYYGSLNVAEDLSVLHEHFAKLGDDKKLEIVQRYALQRGYGTMVEVPDEDAGGLKSQEARGMSTPPGSPNVSPDDPSQVTLMGQFNELMETDETTVQPGQTGDKTGQDT